jgi:hypothetical protein
MERSNEREGSSRHPIAIGTPPSQRERNSALIWYRRKFPRTGGGGGCGDKLISGALVRRGEIEQVLAFFLPPRERRAKFAVKIRGSANFYLLKPNTGEGARSVSAGSRPLRVPEPGPARMAKAERLRSTAEEWIKFIGVSLRAA